MECFQVANWEISVAAGSGIAADHMTGADQAAAAALKLGTADLAPRINRTVAAAFAHPDTRSQPSS